MLLSNARNVSGFQEYFKSNIGVESPDMNTAGEEAEQQEQALETKIPKSTPESRAEDLEEIKKREPISTNFNFSDLQKPWQT